MLRLADRSFLNLTIDETGLYGMGSCASEWIALHLQMIRHSLVKLSGMSSQMAEGLVQAADRDSTNTQECWESFDPVPGAPSSCS